MNKARFTSTGRLLRAVLEETGLTQAEFFKQTGLSEPSGKRILNDTPSAHGDKIKAGFAFVEMVARFARITPYEVYSLLGLTERMFFVPRTGDHSQIYLGPLVETSAKHPYIDEAISQALEARRLYANHGGKAIRQALSMYETALTAAYKAKAIPLAAYIETFAGNLHEMAGEPIVAERMLTAAQEKANDIIREAHRFDKPELLRTAQIISLRAQINLLWTAWAQGDFLRVLQEAGPIGSGILITNQGDDSALGELAYRIKDYYAIPRIYTLLARTYMGLHLETQAKQTIERAVAFSYRYSTSPNYTKEALFLDYPYADERGYLWHIDQQLAAQVDILIASGEVEHAYTVYREIHLHGRPGAHLNFHNWFNRKWQHYLAQMRRIEPLLTDPKLGYTFEEWEKEFGTDPHLQSLNMRAFALAEREEGRLDSAIFYLEQAMEIAGRHSVNYVYILSGIECSTLHLEQRDLALAHRKLNMVKEKLDKYTNPHWVTEYENARRAVAQLG